MAFDFSNAQGDTGVKSYLFKKGVNVTYLKGDEKRPLTFRILPAFPEHDGELTPEEKETSYVPAVSLIEGQPVIADWVFAIYVSRCYVKGMAPVLSRKTIVERNQDGSLVQQEDPLSQVVNFCQHNKEWDYVINDIGKYGDPNRKMAKLPVPKREFLMNVLSFDDEKPGVKVGVVSSAMPMYDLISTKQGSEGYALRQTPRELTDEEILQNPSCVFAYGDITDPNSAPLFRMTKGLTNDNRKVNMIKLAMAIDPTTGRQRLEKVGLDISQMAQRQDLAHPEMYLNIPTPEEQVEQIVQHLGGRNPETGIHEYDMLRMALPGYASLIPDVPPAPGAAPVVQGVSFQDAAPAQTTAAQPQVVHQPRTFAPAQTAPVVSGATATWVGGPSADAASSGAPQANAAQAQAFRSQAQPQAFRPQAQPQPQSQPRPQATKAPVVAKVAKAAAAAAPATPAEPAAQGIPGEAEFDADDWASRYLAKGGK